MFLIEVEMARIFFCPPAALVFGPPAWSLSGPPPQVLLWSFYLSQWRIFIHFDLRKRDMKLVLKIALVWVIYAHLLNSLLPSLLSSYLLLAVFVYGLIWKQFFFLL